MIAAKLFLGLFAAWLLGDLIVYLFDAKKKISWLEGAALSYLIGQGALTFMLFLLFLLPITNQPVIVVLLVVTAAAWKMFFAKNKHLIGPAVVINGLRQYFGGKKSALFVWLLVVLITALSCKILYSFVETCSKPEYSWDASGNWTLAGKAYFYSEKQGPGEVLGELKKSVNGYPREISLMHYWLFWWMGEANDQRSKIIFPIELLCLLVIFYYNMKPARGHLGALAFTYFLCSSPLLLYHSTIGYADLTKTIYFAAGIIYFYRWLQTRQNNYFWFFAFSLVLTTWVKLEGKALYAIGLALLLIYLWLGCKEAIKNKVFYVGKYLFVLLLIGLPWQLFTRFNGLTDPQNTIGFSFSQFFEFHEKMYALMFLDGSWGIFWVLAAAITLLFIKRQIAGENLYLLMVIILFYGNLLFIYMGFHGTIGAMVANFNRVLLPLYPVAVFNLGWVAPKLSISPEIEI